MEEPSMAKRYQVINGLVSVAHNLDDYQKWSGMTAVVFARDHETLAQAAREVIDEMDLTCQRASEEISVAEGCPCVVCTLQRLAVPMTDVPPR
jgi:hypothetical protein